jgi:hypothetical protein
MKNKSSNKNVISFVTRCCFDSTSPSDLLHVFKERDILPCITSPTLKPCNNPQRLYSWFPILNPQSPYPSIVLKSCGWVAWIIQHNLPIDTASSTIVPYQCLHLLEVSFYNSPTIPHKYTFEDWADKSSRYLRSHYERLAVDGNVAYQSPQVLLRLL